MNNGDLISRQSVLNACEQSINILEAVDRIMDLPSVEQEPCEDAISRKEVHDLIAKLLSDYLHDEDREKIEKLDIDIEKLLSVNPQEPKIGHWIIYNSCEGKTRQCTCDQCGYKTGEYTWHNPNFCENCGAQMVEPQERSDKE